MLNSTLIKILAIAFTIFINRCDSYVNEHMEIPYNVPVFTSFGNKTYYLEDRKLQNWFLAYTTCKQYNMELVTIDSDEEFDQLRNFINALVSPTNRHHVWTSGMDLGSEGHFIWMSNGRRIKSNRWHTGQPSNANNKEHCVHFWYTSNIYLLNDAMCLDKMAFICQSVKKSSYNVIHVNDC